MFNRLKVCIAKNPFKVCFSGGRICITRLPTGVEKAGPCPDQLLAIAGGNRSRLWLKAIATNLNTAIARPIDGEYRATMGAARLAILGKTSEPLNNIVSHPTISEISEPKTDLSDLYSEAFTLYESASSYLKST